MTATASLPEVRRCAACGAAAMIPVQVWQHTGTFARPGQVTIDCRCQQCGAGVSLFDQQVIRNEQTAGRFLVWTLIAPAILLPRSARRAKAWADHPIVPGAPLPPLRFDRPESTRRCGACGQMARLTNVTQHRTNGIPSGTDRTYLCGGCGATFTTESAGGIIMNILGALLFGGGGLVGLLSPGAANTTSEKYVLMPLALVGGAYFTWLVVKSISTNMRNPAT